jgi:hypothetical protein
MNATANDIGVPLTGDLGPSIHERASASPARVAFSAERRAPAHAPTAVEPLALPLHDLQAWFVSAIVHPDGVAASLDESGVAARFGVSESSIQRLVRPSSTLSGAERIHIYRDAYRSRLVECLADDYPAVKHALGETDFDVAAGAFIDAHPSRSPSLNFYGRPFAPFLRTWSHPLTPFAADLASLEWALVEVLHAGAPLRLSHEKLTAVPPSSWVSARFAGSDTVRLVELAYPANAYFQAFRQGAEVSPPEAAWSATAVFRDGATLWRMELSRPMHLLLRELFAGRSLGLAVEALVAELGATPEGGSDVMLWFRDWVHHGFFSRIIVSER